MFKLASGTDIANIPYKGGAQALTDMVGGQAQVMFNGMLATYPFVKDGKLKVLAISSAKRFSAAPEIPTVAESGMPGFETGSWQGIFVPTGTPREIVQKLNTSLNALLKQGDVPERLKKLNVDYRENTPEEFGTFVKAEMEKWSRVVKEANIKLG
jgi:tripartite-type tricarboxylate transporter receptor subunit TctC